MIWFELSNPTWVLLNELSMPELRRNDVALTYALALRSSQKTDWCEVNEAIVKRWSRSSLEYIKHRAWRLWNREAKP